MVQRQFRIDDFIKGLRAGGEVFHAVAGPLDRAPEPPRRGADEDLFRIERSLAAETAAHVRGHDANPVAGRSSAIASASRTMPGTCVEECSVSASRPGSYSARQARPRSRPASCDDAEAAADAHRRGGKHLVRLAALELPVHQHIGAGFFMQERRSGTHGLLGVNDGGQRFVVDAEEFERVLGEVAVFGDDAHDRLADVAHLATRQRQDRCRVIMGHARGRDQRLDRQILGGESSRRCRGGARGGSVDRANARMRLVAPAEGDLRSHDTGGRAVPRVRPLRRPRSTPAHRARNPRHRPGNRDVACARVGREPAEPGAHGAAATPTVSGCDRRTDARAGLALRRASSRPRLGSWPPSSSRSSPAGWSPGDPTGAGSPLHDAYLEATTATFLAIVFCQVGTVFARSHGTRRVAVDRRAVQPDAALGHCVRARVRGRHHLHPAVPRHLPDRDRERRRPASHAAVPVHRLGRRRDPTLAGAPQRRPAVCGILNRCRWSIRSSRRSSTTCAPRTQRPRHARGSSPQQLDPDGDLLAQVRSMMEPGGVFGQPLVDDGRRNARSRAPTATRSRSGCSCPTPSTRCTSRSTAARS